MSADRWLTHNQAADELGIKPVSLRIRAKREKWEEGTDSQGKPIFLIPVDAAAKGQRARSIKAAKPDEAEPSPDLTALQRRIGELEADLTAARAERDQERAERQRDCERADRATSETAEVALRMAATVDESRAMAKAARRRAEAAEAERDAAIDSHRKEVERLGAMVAHMLAAHDFAQLPRWRQIIAPRPPSTISFDMMAFRRDRQAAR